MHTKFRSISISFLGYKHLETFSQPDIHPSHPSKPNQSKHMIWDTLKMLHDFFSAPWTNGAAAGMEGWSVGGKHFSFFRRLFPNCHALLHIVGCSNPSMWSLDDYKSKSDILGVVVFLYVAVAFCVVASNFHFTDLFNKIWLHVRLYVWLAHYTVIIIFRVFCVFFD